MKFTALVKPNSKHREGVLEAEDGTLIVYTKEPATEGRANIAIVGLIAKHFGVTKSQVRLVHGKATKYKIFEIEK